MVTGEASVDAWTRRRLAKWDHPRRLHGWRRAASISGRAFTAVGVLLFGFVAYQLWGTSLETARAQRALASEFDELLATITTTTPTPTATPTTTATPPTPTGSVPDDEPPPS
jgi:sortase A